MYWGELRSIPADAGEPSFPPCAKSTLICPPLVGSGKLGTPWERMQWTYAKAARYFAVVLLPLAAAGEDDADVAVALEPRLATPDERDPPHAEVIRPRHTRTSTGTHRWRRPTVSGLVIAFSITKHLYAIAGCAEVTGVTGMCPLPGRLTVPLGSGLDWFKALIWHLRNRYCAALNFWSILTLFKVIGQIRPPWPAAVVDQQVFACVDLAGELGRIRVDVYVENRATVGIVGGVGPVRHPVLAHAVSELHHGAQDLLPLGRGRPVSAVREQVAAGGPGLLELVRVAQRDLFRAGREVPAAVGVGEVRHAVTPHAPRECERLQGG
jgi:hypothetical protein